MVQQFLVQGSSIPEQKILLPHWSGLPSGRVHPGCFWLIPGAMGSRLRLNLGWFSAYIGSGANQDLVPCVRPPIYRRFKGVILEIFSAFSAWLMQISQLNRLHEDQQALRTLVFRLCQGSFLWVPLLDLSCLWRVSLALDLVQLGPPCLQRPPCQIRRSHVFKIPHWVVPFSAIWWGERPFANVARLHRRF